MQTDPLRAIACPCCGYETLTALANDETCPICGWRDVPLDETVPPRWVHPVSLIAAQRNFITFGACDQDARRYVCAPRATDRRRPDWQPIEVDLRQQQQQLLAGFIARKPSLLELLAPLVDDRMLESIADSDYGMNRAANLAGLQALRAGDPWPEPEYGLNPAWLAWANVVEVLRLTSWSDPPLWDNSERGRRWHTEVAFTCATLLGVIDEPMQEFESENPWII